MCENVYFLVFLSFSFLNEKTRVGTSQVWWYMPVTPVFKRQVGGLQVWSHPRLHKGSGSGGSGEDISVGDLAYTSAEPSVDWRHFEAVCVSSLVLVSLTPFANSP